MAALLSNSRSCIWAIISACQDWNVSSSSAEYLPLNLVIFGSHIQQNFDTWAATAADTPAAIAAASWGLPSHRWDMTDIKSSIHWLHTMMWCG